VVDPIVPLIASLRLRNLLSETVEEVLAKAATHPERKIEIGTLGDAHKPVLCRVDMRGRYQDNALLHSRCVIATTTADMCRIAGVVGVPKRCGHA
jgi:hypothetical protein